MDINQVLLTGNLGSDVEVKTSGDTTYARFSVASNYRVRAESGEGYEDRCNWTRVTAFGGLARALGRLGKGSSVLVQGRLQHRVYEKDETRFQYSEVIAKSVKFLLVKPPEGAEEVEPEVPDVDFDPTADDDIPF